MTMVEPRQLSQADHHARALNRAVTEILRVWPRALEDADSRGYPPGRGYDSAGGGNGGITVALPDGSVESVPATAVERLVLSGDRSIESRAVAWLAELGDVVVELPLTIYPPAGPSLRAAILRLDRDADRRLCLRIFRLADEGSAWWPKPPKAGQSVAGVTVGQRGNSVELCKLCLQPVAGGRADPIRRIDGEPYHGKTCWWTVTRSRNRGA